MTSSDQSTEQSDSAAIADMLVVIVSARRRIFTAAFVFAVLVGLYVLSGRRSYSVDVSFTAQTAGANAARLAGLAAQFGVSLGGADGGASPAFYSELIRSREIQSRLVNSEYRVVVPRRFPPWSRDSTVIEGDLVRVFEIETEGDGRAREEARAMLSEMMGTRVGRESGLITTAVTSFSPSLSHDIASRLLELVNEFNLSQRQSTAAAERGFAESRLAVAESELRAAEAALQSFLVRNRTFEGSPQLAFEHDRLSREVAMRQQIFTLLTQAHEQARIEEVRSTPVITVVQRPVVPAIPNRRYLPYKVVAAFVFAMLLGAVLQIAVEMVKAWFNRDPDGRLQRLLGSSVSGLTTRLRRPSSRAST